MNERKLNLFLVVIVMAIIVLNGCGQFESVGGAAASGLTININDRVVSKALMPDVSLVCDHFAVHGEGTSGAATGATFDVDVTAAAASITLDLLPGDWTIDVIAWNDETPSVAVGGGGGTALVAIGVPQTLNVTVLPFAGDGTLDISVGWIPDILADPYILVETQPFGGAAADFPMTVTSSVTAEGTGLLGDGWYSGFLRIYEGDPLTTGEITAGIVKTIRIAKDATTVWDEFLQVSQLEGEFTIDLDYYPGLPLNLTTSHTEGNLNIYIGDDFNLEIVGADNDTGTSLIYTWYMNGVGVALGSASTYNILATEYEIGVSYYLSCLVFQDDGIRAADAQWKIIANEFALSQYDIEMLVTASTTTTKTIEVQLLDEFFTVIAETVASHDFTPTNPYSTSLLACPTVSLAHLRVVCGNAVTGDIHSGDRYIYFAPDGSFLPEGTAPTAVYEIPHPLGATYQIDYAEFWIAP